MRISPADDIRARIARARDAEPGGAIACDGDGTLWSGDVGEDLFHALLARGPILRAAHERMRAEAAAHAVDASGTSLALARRIYDAYVAHAFPEEPVCELMAWAFAEWTRADVASFAREVIAAAGLEARVHREVTDALAWAGAEGIDVWLVSASPRAVVEEAARAVGIAPERVLAATPLYAQDALLADVARPIPYGPGKVHAIRGAIGARPLYAAFGDNAFDVAMLREARVPVAVRPKARLRERAREVEGLVEIAAPPDAR